ncbi:MAG: hypothetical protein FWE53_02300 [Firmicutes bacterium]|nr:hypothetical protein [Bacillota bacterium]
MEILKDISLYFSAFIPMYFLIQVKFAVDMIFGNVEPSVLNFCVLAFLALLIACGVVGLLWNIVWNKDKADEIKITDSKNITDQHFLGYFSIFILFALSFDLTKVSMFSVFVFIIIFVGIVYVKNKLFYINPFLNILGFNFYEITYTKSGQEKQDTAKLFYRGKLEVNQTVSVKLKNDHFSFVEKTRNR